LFLQAFWDLTIPPPRNLSRGVKALDTQWIYLHQEIKNNL